MTILKDRVEDLRSKAKSNKIFTSRKRLLQDSQKIQNSAKKSKVFSEVFSEVTEGAAPLEAPSLLNGITAATVADLTAKGDNDAAASPTMTPKPARAFT